MTLELGPDLDRILPDAQGRSKALRDAQIRHLIHVWRQRLNLTNWEIRYDTGDPTDPEEREAGTTYQARVAYRLNELIAQLRIDPNLPDAMVESCVVHELLHLVVKRYAHLAGALCANVRGEAARDILADQLHDEEEQFIDAMARALTGAPRFIAYGEGLEDRYPAFAA